MTKIVECSNCGVLYAPHNYKCPVCKKKRLPYTSNVYDLKAEDWD